MAPPSVSAMSAVETPSSAMPMMGGLTVPSSATDAPP
jgi:hypothetical protein